MAELQGNSALSGGVGAVSGELASKVIINTLYGGKDASELTEDEKQTISALSQLASGLAVAAGGGNFGDASAAINKDAGKDSQDGKMGNGQKMWVHGKGTEHIAEYAQFTAKNYTPKAVRNNLIVYRMLSI